MTLKVAVLAPTRKAIVTAAVSVKIGLFRSVRPANTKLLGAMLPPRIPLGVVASESYPGSRLIYRFALVRPLAIYDMSDAAGGLFPSIFPDEVTRRKARRFAMQRTTHMTLAGENG